MRETGLTDRVGQEVRRDRRPARGRRSEGLYVLCKPPGMTSHDVVSYVRRVTGERRVGHAGTLDPPAAGVLLVLVGPSVTRLAEYLLDLPKTYLAEIRFGQETDTQDHSGTVVGGSPAAAARLARSDVAEVLQRFEGVIKQVPPMVSAVRVDGERLYRAAREGREVARPARTVTVHRLELLDFVPGEGRGAAGCPAARVRVRCSRGTYVRTLAHDLGRALGVGAHLGFLVREGVGGFVLEASLTLEEFAEAARCGDLEAVAVAPADALAHLPCVRPSRRDLARVAHGERVPWTGVVEPGAGGRTGRAAGPDGPAGRSHLVRVLGEDGNLVAVARLDGRWLRPCKVLRPGPKGGGPGV
ncbi:MAG TPA: tRNA pseudouridine(55) synthase TruB [Clostridiales bacterium]|nr:tRNA pseudouridine(55) synthase TruB [Clostridiales bacterium]